ncbi:hypothetical protein O181_081274 [Austropuccinia psidii MF-1]|uniref:Integrase catalytic domain-containing protein n=1 Tax=Austropuccinia psidii MF-1 TaxID=1389203 RepID=A0A9Q3FM19_9BASI|nr:hypothetical protein [Austropuccinia psidii MF-1]
MDWETALPPGGDRSFNEFPVLVKRYPKFTSALWENLHKFFGTKLSISTEYNPGIAGISERIIHNLEGMIRRSCAYGLEFKDSDGFTHDWCTLIPVLELAYKTSIHSSTSKTPAMLEEGCNTILPYETLKRTWLIYIQQQAVLK